MINSPATNEVSLCERTGASTLARTPSRVQLPARFVGLPGRFALLSLLLAAEGIPFSSVIHKSWGAGMLLEVVMVFVPLLLVFSYAKAREIFQAVSAELRITPVHWALLTGHVAALLAFLGLSLQPTPPSAIAAGFLAGFWYTTGFLALAFAVCTFVPMRFLLRLVRGAGFSWVFALGAAVIARGILVNTTLWNGRVWNPAVDLSWKPVIDLTFDLVRILLRVFLSNVVADRATMSIGTPGFHVEIAPWCAGYEGTALMLVFGAAWLAFFRREYRFPQSLLLIPAGMIVIWFFNAIRITVLILIGVAGAPNVAVNGFHSQAGWIIFTGLALTFAVLSRRLAWVTLVSSTGARPGARFEPVAHNPTAAYLMPFVVLMAAGMLSTAASAGFEWFYPLRVLSAAIALWYFRRTYSELDWRFGWLSALAGVAVFCIWLGLDQFTGAHADNGIGAGLASLSFAGRIAWLTLRTLGAVVTVPIAEELAFRGFLIRRIISADFDSLDTRRYTYLAVLASSVAFGVLHGGRWIAGSVAGVIYAVAFLRRGRIGDAVFAHALTNALLAAWVLMGGRWYLW